MIILWPWSRDAVIAPYEQEIAHLQDINAQLDQAITDIMNRRVDVENFLLRAAAGQLPLPDAQKCHDLAMYLGDPTFTTKP